MRREDFWSKVKKSDGCWEWTGATGTGGYGALYLTKEGMQRAHRIAFELTYGDIDSGLAICHKCDNRICVRPDHLFQGTIAENNADMDQKGRRKAQGSPGIKNPRARLSEDEVRDIRRLYASGGFSQQEIAEMYDVKQVAISRITRKTAWSSLKD